MDYLPVAHVKALQKVMYVGAAWTEVKYDTTPLEGRKWVEIFNRSAYKIFYSYDDTSNVQGCFALRAGGKLILPLSECVPIYLQSSQATGSTKVIIAEVA